MSVAPVAVDEPINTQILAVSEDQIEGFVRDPMGEIAMRCGLPRSVVVERIVAMLRAGTIRRVRLTLLATNLAHGALAAWKVPADRLDAAFDWMFANDPFTGHVVIRSTDARISGAQYRLWTTLKVPQFYSIEKHARLLAARTGAEAFRLMPARKLFVLGVGHVRRRNLEIGARARTAAEPRDAEVVSLSEHEWQVLTAAKREFAPEELQSDDLWRCRQTPTKEVGRLPTPGSHRESLLATGARARAEASS